MTVLVVTLALCPLSAKSSGAAVSERASNRDPRTSAGHELTVFARSETAVMQDCIDARRGLAYYQHRAAWWRAKTGAGTRATSAYSRAGGATSSRPLSCPHIRLWASRWRARAQRARLAYEHWYAWAWHPRIPRFDRAVAMCETRANFRHHAGAYEGAWGWYHGTWLLDRPPGAPEHAYDATPRQQWLAFRRGWYGLHHYWGCIANGGYREHM